MNFRKSSKIFENQKVDFFQILFFLNRNNIVCLHFGILKKMYTLENISHLSLPPLRE